MPRWMQAQSRAPLGDNQQNSDFLPELLTVCPKGWGASPAPRGFPAPAPVPDAQLSSSHIRGRRAGSRTNLNKKQRAWKENEPNEQKSHQHKRYYSAISTVSFNVRELAGGGRLWLSTAPSCLHKGLHPPAPHSRPSVGASGCSMSPSPACEAASLGGSSRSLTPVPPAARPALCSLPAWGTACSPPWGAACTLERSSREPGSIPEWGPSGVSHRVPLSLFPHLRTALQGAHTRQDPERTSAVVWQCGGSLLNQSRFFHPTPTKA